MSYCKNCDAPLYSLLSNLCRDCVAEGLITSVEALLGELIAQENIKRGGGVQ